MFCPAGPGEGPRTYSKLNPNRKERKTPRGTSIIKKTTASFITHKKITIATWRCKVSEKEIFNILPNRIPGITR